MYVTRKRGPQPILARKEMRTQLFFFSPTLRPPGPTSPANINDARGPATVGGRLVVRFPSGAHLRGCYPRCHGRDWKSCRISSPTRHLRRRRHSDREATYRSFDEGHPLVRLATLVRWQHCNCGGALAGHESDPCAAASQHAPPPRRCRLRWSGQRRVLLSDATASTQAAPSSVDATSASAPTACAAPRPAADRLRARGGSRHRGCEQSRAARTVARGRTPICVLAHRGARGGVCCTAKGRGDAVVAAHGGAGARTRRRHGPAGAAATLLLRLFWERRCRGLPCGVTLWRANRSRHRRRSACRGLTRHTLARQSASPGPPRVAAHPAPTTATVDAASALAKSADSSPQRLRGAWAG